MPFSTDNAAIWTDPSSATAASMLMCSSMRFRFWLISNDQFNLPLNGSNIACPAFSLGKREMRERRRSSLAISGKCLEALAHFLLVSAKIQFRRTACEL